MNAEREKEKDKMIGTNVKHCTNRQMKEKKRIKIYIGINTKRIRKKIRRKKELKKEQNVQIEERKRTDEIGTKKPKIEKRNTAKENLIDEVKDTKLTG